MNKMMALQIEVPRPRAAGARDAAAGGAGQRGAVPRAPPLLDTRAADRRASTLCECLTDAYLPTNQIIHDSYYL